MFKCIALIFIIYYISYIHNHQWIKLLDRARVLEIIVPVLMVSDILGKKVLSSGYLYMICFMVSWMPKFTNSYFNLSSSLWIKFANNHKDSTYFIFSCAVDHSDRLRMLCYSLIMGSILLMMSLANVEVPLANRNPIMVIA